MAFCLLGIKMIENLVAQKATNLAARWSFELLFSIFLCFTMVQIVHVAILYLNCYSNYTEVHSNAAFKW
jgi:hypothetical protein